MGRGGASGGRSSGGSFGGSRSSGGRSGGGFSSGRGFSGGSGGFGGSRNVGSGSSFGNSSRGRRVSSSSPGNLFGGRSRNYYGGNTRPPQRYSSGGPGMGGVGCGGCLTIVVIIFILLIFFYMMQPSYFSDISTSGEITKSTVEREALPKGSVNETGYYTDELGWIKKSSTLLAGMKNFYQETGVQPYLYLTDTVNGSHYPSTAELDAFANSLYDQLFTDEAHILLVFFEFNGQYMDRYVCGTQAKTVIDSEAADILLDYVDKYYYDSSLSEDELFSKAFDEAATRIMTVTKSPWIPVLVVFGVALILFILFRWWISKKQKDKEEAEQLQKTLSTPLEKFGDKETEDLAKQYEDQDQ